jgi:hypothetical protein
MEANRVSNEIGNAHSSPTHPNPYSEGLLVHSLTSVCGLASPERLLEWFDGWLSRFNDAGFRIRIYNSPDWWVQVGKKQVVFNKSESILISDYSVVDFRDRFW